MEKEYPGAPIEKSFTLSPLKSAIPRIALPKRSPVASPIISNPSEELLVGSVTVDSQADFPKTTSTTPIWETGEHVCEEIAKSEKPSPLISPIFATANPNPEQFGIVKTVHEEVPSKFVMLGELQAIAEVPKIR